MALAQRVSQAFLGSSRPAVARVRVCMMATHQENCRKLGLSIGLASLPELLPQRTAMHRLAATSAHRNSAVQQQGRLPLAMAHLPQAGSLQWLPALPVHAIGVCCRCRYRLCGPPSRRASWLQRRRLCLAACLEAASSQMTRREQQLLSPTSVSWGAGQRRLPVVTARGGSADPLFVLLPPVRRGLRLHLPR
jgi:hypothetical protein